MLIFSRSDNLFLVPAKPQLERIESIESLEENDDDIDYNIDSLAHKQLIKQKSLGTLEREFQLG